jgi:hypothetical protein
MRYEFFPSQNGLLPTLSSTYLQALISIPTYSLPLSCTYLQTLISLPIDSLPKVNDNHVF